MTRVLAIAIALALVASLLALSQCQRLRVAGVQSKVDQGQTAALGNSAADAVGTVGQAGQREAASEDLTRTNEQEIRNAPGANQPIDTRLHDVGLRALCERDAYRGSQQCAVFQPRP